MSEFRVLFACASPHDHDLPDPFGRGHEAHTGVAGMMATAVERTGTGFRS